LQIEESEVITGKIIPAPKNRYETYIPTTIGHVQAQVGSISRHHRTATMFLGGTHNGDPCVSESVDSESPDYSLDLEKKEK